MPITLDDLEDLAGADVVDAKGELIGIVSGPHVLAGELLGVRVALDDALAELPTVGRDEVEIATRYLARDGESLRVAMELMEAIAGHAPARRAGASE